MISRAVVLRSAVFAVLIAVGVLVLSGRPSGAGIAFFDSDFDPFEAARAIVDDGLNPYEPGAIDAELEAGGPGYSDDFGRYPGGQPRIFFNPPFWLTMLGAVGFSSNVVVIGGVLVFAFALGLLASRSPGTAAADHWVLLTVLGMMVLVWDRLFLWANAGFGQTGYVIGAAMSGSLLLRDRAAAAGASGAVLAFKPHLWIAHWIAFGARFRRAALWQIGWSALIAATSIAHLGWRMWAWYFEALTTSHSERPTVQALTFTVLAPVMREPVTIAVTAVAVAAVVVCVWRAPVRFEARWVLTVALVMMASTHAFWHDWAWLLAVPLLLGWPLLVSVGFYLSIPLVSLYTNAGPAWVLLGWLGYVAYSELRRDREAEPSTDIVTVASDPALVR